MTHDAIAAPGERAQRTNTAPAIESTSANINAASRRHHKSKPAFIVCARCNAAWTGLSRCHCASCHLTFTGITAFDIHRSASRCVHPADVPHDKTGNPRLIRVHETHWTGWCWPGEDNRWAAEA